MNHEVYSDETIKNRISELLETPRMYHIPLISEEHGHANTTKGLLDLVKECINTKDIVVEVGCFSGVSSRIFALGCRELHCIDPYSWPATFQAEKMFESMLPEYPNIKKIKMTSVDGSKLYEDYSIDFIYIDADHTYESVIQDIESWQSKVKKGGYLGGHDIYIPDVKKAVEEKFGNKYKTYSDTSWVVKL
jgi:predicted O-methyltransferase YrrM